MDNIKKDCWDITALCRVRMRVVFEEEVTADEAEELFHSGNFEDIIDEDNYSTESVLSVE